MKHKPIIESFDQRQGVHIITYDTLQVTLDHETGPARYSVESFWEGPRSSPESVNLLTTEEAEQIAEGLTRLLESAKGGPE